MLFHNGISQNKHTYEKCNEKCSEDILRIRPIVVTSAVSAEVWWERSAYHKVVIDYNSYTGNSSWMDQWWHVTPQAGGHHYQTSLWVEYASGNIGEVVTSFEPFEVIDANFSIAKSGPLEGDLRLQMVKTYYRFYNPTAYETIVHIHVVGIKLNELGYVLPGMYESFTWVVVPPYTMIEHEVGGESGDNWSGVVYCSLQAAG